MAQKVAVLGAGLTKFMRRAKETGKELAFEAAKMALEEAKMDISEIECVVMATAPDMFDGVHMKGDWLSDGAGAKRKPYMRSYVGGGSGVFGIIHGWYLVASGLFDTCLVVAEEKMSSSMPHPQGTFNAIYDQFLERPLGVNLLWIFSLEMMRYIHVHKIPLETISLVSQYLLFLLKTKKMHLTILVHRRELQAIIPLKMFSILRLLLILSTD